jgi:endo-1,4-beta-xylanase
MSTCRFEVLEARRVMNAVAKVRLFIDQSQAIENASLPVQFTVVRNAVGISSPLTVNLAYTGSATSGTDYVAPPTSVVIPANQRSATVSINVNNDAQSESTESLTVSIQASSNYSTGALSTRSGTAQLFDDDSLGTGTATIGNPPTFSSYGLTRSTVSVTGQSFTSAQRLVVSTATGNVWSSALQTPNTAAITQGNKLLLRFWARSTNANAPGTGVAAVQLGTSPWTKSLFTRFNLTGNAWREFLIPLEAAMNHATSGSTRASIEFQVGDLVQDIQIAAVSLTNYGSNVSLDNLPRTPQTYKGRGGTELNWRDAAEARVEQLRTANLDIELRDSSGNLIENATVRSRLKKHDFGFGSAVDSRTLLGQTGISSTDVANYRNRLTQYFNASVVLENDLKQWSWENFPQNAINGINWLNNNGIDDIRGHNIIWPSWGYMPSSPGVSNYGGISFDQDPDKEPSQEEYEAHVQIDGLAAANQWLRNRIANHIQQQISHPQLAGRVVDWDVMNEGVYNTDVQQILGDSVMTSWYQIARQANPNARLFMNDYPPMYDSAHEDAYVELIQNMLSEGAPIDGIGLQSHFNFETPGIDQMQASFDRFAAFGKDVQITEYDSRVLDPQLRADFTRDYMLLAFSQPGVSAFLNWGFWAGMHWIPDAAFYDLNWNLRPHGQVWVDLVSSEWSTDVTQSSGASPFRAYFGDYEFTITQGSRTYTRTASFNEAGTVTLAIPDEVRPVVSTSAFNFETAHEARFNFSEDVLASLAAADFEVRNLTTSTLLPASSYSLQASNTSGKTTARLVFSPLLADGRYSITLKSQSVIDRAGLTNASSTVISTHVLAGDADRNGSVNFSDLVILARNFNTSGKTFSQGNFNYDANGTVDFADLVLLARNFNVVLAPLVLGTGTSARGRVREVLE